MNILIIMFATPTVSLVRGVQGFQKPMDYVLNRKQTRKIINAILLSVLVFSLVGLPGISIAGTPVIQSIGNVLPGTMGSGLAHTGHFILYYFHYGHFPSKSTWIYFLEGLGLTYAISALIAGLLVLAGWITVATATGVLASTGTGIGIAAAIASF